MSSVGKTFILFGVILILAGILIQIAGKVPGIGRLPGDILIKKGNWTFYFPLATSILISVVLTLVFSLLGRK